MHNILTSRGSPVNFRPQIVLSMWDGWEIGGADGHSVPCGEMVLSCVRALPTVVEVLPALDGYQELDDRITRNVLRVPHG